MNKRQLGKEKEELVCKFLMGKGYQILAVNYICRGAELDIVAKDGDCLVFVEVKYRKNSNCGGSRYAVSKVKMQRIIKGAEYYLYRERVSPDIQIRFDVVALEGEKIAHYINAFDGQGQCPMGS